MKSTYWLLPLIMVLFFSIAVPAQRTNRPGDDTYPVFSLRTSLTSYLDYDAGIMLGINYRWAPHFSASFEPTWIFYNGFVTNRDEKIFPSGVKIRSDLRYHFSRRRNGSPEVFMGAEFHYKYTKTGREDLFGINCQNGQCAYFQDAVYSEIKNEIGGQFKLGIIAPLSFISKNDRLLLEVYNGFGVKQLKYRETDLPIGGSFVNPPNRAIFSIGTRNTRNTFNRPMLPFGIKFIFIL